MLTSIRISRTFAVAALAALLALCAATAFPAIAQTPTPGRTPSASPSASPCRTFPETGKTACGRFLQYWESHGGLMQQGYPISREFQERSEVDGKTYTVQYFERAVFEAHPENKPPYDVLLSLLGSIRLREKYPSGPPDGDEGLMTGESRFFPETGKTVYGPFLKYWREHGGLAQQGYPISNPMFESRTRTSPARIVQYFERAVFELHPENEERFGVLLALLGVEQFQKKYPKGEPTPAALPSTTPPATPTDVWASLRARPLQLPPLAAGAPCPNGPATQVHPNVGLALGSGPAYPVGFEANGVYKYGSTIEEGGWYLLKVLWVADPGRYDGPILVRGGRIDAPGELRFGPGPTPAADLPLDPKDALTPEDWPDWPTYTRLRGPGCYAYQVDGTTFTQTIVFRAER